MPRYDLLLKGGTVIDGQRTPRFTSDIAIADGRIAQIGSVSESDAARVFDARDLIVAPGFIDLHTHFDSQLFWDPYCTMSGCHGVTSVVIGNCGFGFAPVNPSIASARCSLSSATRLCGPPRWPAGMPWDWVTFPEFLNSVERTPKGVNVLSYMGLSPVMSWVMGLDDAKGRPASAAEQKKMSALLGEAMDAGACGFSAQILGPDSVQRDYDALRSLPPERLHDFPANDWRLAQKAEGYRLTMVNGEVTFEDGECTGATPGALLRHGRTA